MKLCKPSCQPVSSLKKHCKQPYIGKRVKMKRGIRQENGQGLVEYALILVLVAVIVIAILTLLGPQVGNVFSRVVHGMGGATSSGGGGGGSTPTGNVTGVSALRGVGGADVVVTITVSAEVSVTAVDSQSGQTGTLNCNLSCTVILPGVGPNSGTVTVTAAGGNSMSDTYPTQN
jgi:pilus assembly protein Flp/PilA